MLDTCACIEVIRKRGGPILERLIRCGAGGACVSAITLSELEYGVEKSTSPERNRLALLAFVAPLQVLSYDDRAANAYGAVRADLESRGEGIGPLDTLIAAHALAIGATLVTANLREFARVPGLKVVDWSV
jgi:tRNA(fMet)-specific endonuclease VapC